MPDYKRLYHLMANASEDALAALQTGNIRAAQRILITAEQTAEERYVEDEAPAFKPSRRRGAQYSVNSPKGLSLIFKEEPT